METYYHAWLYRRALDGAISSMERDHAVFSTLHKANYALSDGRQYWSAGQALQCVAGAFCQPLPDEIVDQNMPFGPKYVPIEQLAEQGKSIRPSAKHVKVIEERELLDADGRIKGLEAVKAELVERQSAVDSKLAQLMQKIYPDKSGFP